MRTYVLRRLLLFIPTLVLASVLVFVTMRVLPGDVTGALLGGEGEALRPETVQALRSELGLDTPLMEQYLRWVWSMATGDFGGVSLTTREPVRTIVARQLPVTVLLAIYAAALAVAVSIPTGVLAAWFANRWPDALIRGVSVAGSAVPGFWVALLILLMVAHLFRWSPPLVYVHPWHDLLDHVGVMTIPALVLAWELGGQLVRVTRACVLESSRQDYIRTAVAKGMSRRRVLSRHALRAAAIPILTVAGVHLGALLSGAVSLEYVFGIPGLGRSLVQAVAARDYPVVQSLAMVLVSITLVVNLLVDLAYAVADPRIRYGD